MNYFAEEFIPPTGMMQWVACVAFTIFLLDRAVSLYRGVQPRPPMDEQLSNLRDEMHRDFATREDLESVVTSMREKLHERDTATEKFRSELRSSIDGLSLKLSQRSDDIFNRIASLGREIAHLEGRTGGKQ